MGVAAALFSLAALTLPSPVRADTTNIDAPIPFAVAKPAPGEKMLVEADQMVYDYDRNQVAAVGNVKVYYAGYTLEAAKLTYNKGNGRLIATGNVKLVDPTGATFYSDYFDVTDDFRDGFIQSLRVDTPERTHFAADKAERTGGNVTTFTNGTYTACEVCAEHPERPPLWDVKAEKIVANQQEHMIYFTNASLEFFGQPIAYLPSFGVPDSTVKRKTGFLVPGFGYSARLGAFASVPYYWALNPSYDFTFTPTFLTRQGVMLEGQFRQRLSNGQYTIDVAGIDQLAPEAFSGKPGDVTLRGAARTTGELNLNQDWTLGWDGTLLSDRAFTRDYNVIDSDTAITTSTIHLTGINDRNYFEARSSYYQVLTDPSAAPITNPGLYDQARQGWVAPVIDSQRQWDDVAGGELTLTTNVANVQRAEDDPFNIGLNTYYHGVAGDELRATQELDWQRRFVTPGGQVFTPFASLRGDAFALNDTTVLGPDTTAFRFTPAVGFEWSYPLLISGPNTTQILEPIVQIIARPNEIDSGDLPNNDAQSLVFDVSNLFDRDKYSGYDRVETGTRANIGLHYNSTFANGASIDGTFGESIQLAGANPYAAADSSNVGAYSGLESTFSDYVAGLSFDSGVGPRFEGRARFDQQTFNLNRVELQATNAIGPVTASAAYLYLRENQNEGLLTSSSVVRGAASLNLSENWRAFGTLTYDIANTAIASDSFGIAFDNDCLTLSFAYGETYASDQPSRTFDFRLALRTFGSGTVSSDLNRVSD
jgi:LPS-assembly protein